jgi:hypothetical protein
VDVGSVTTLWNVYRAAAKFQRQVRSISGGHLPRGKPLVRVLCGRCGSSVATVEVDADGEIVTFWRKRRFPGVPRLLDCPEHGDLWVDEAAMRRKVHQARETGRPQTAKVKPAKRKPQGGEALR